MCKTLFNYLSLDMVDGQLNVPSSSMLAGVQDPSTRLLAGFFGSGRWLDGRATSLFWLNGGAIIVDLCQA